MVVSEDEVDKAFPANFYMIAGNPGTEETNCKVGGNITSAFLERLGKANENGEKLSWAALIRDMKSSLNDKGLDQVPELLTTHNVDVENEIAYVVPTNCTGKKRAVLIGVTYKDGNNGSANEDVIRVRDFLNNTQGYSQENMVTLMVDDVHLDPTKKNIRSSLLEAAKADPGDSVFVYISGMRGSVQLKDVKDDGDDGYRNSLICMDGKISQDDIIRNFVQKTDSGVEVTILMDCCNQGSAFDLPYRYSADSCSSKMDLDLAYKIPKPGKNKFKEDGNWLFFFDPHWACQDCLGTCCAGIVLTIFCCRGNE